MKNLFRFLLLFFMCFLYGQENTAKLPQQWVVIDGKPTPVEQSYVLNVNDQAADFTVQMINGETIKLSNLKGKVVLLNFWATWCAPCLKELRAFPSKIVAPFKDSPFVLLSISKGETLKKVKETMSKLKKDGVDFNVGINPNRTIFDLYGKAGVPKNFLIDRNGTIRYVSSGYNSEEGLNELSSKIQELLDEIPKTRIHN